MALHGRSKASAQRSNTAPKRGFFFCNLKQCKHHTQKRIKQAILGMPTAYSGDCNVSDIESAKQAFLSETAHDRNTQRDRVALRTHCTLCLHLRTHQLIDHEITASVRGDQKIFSKTFNLVLDIKYSKSIMYLERRGKRKSTPSPQGDHHDVRTDLQALPLQREEPQGT